ncbi:hypothetical protein [Paraburkholderia sp. J8-2]|uniref:hypothetical protein n=1 Tax=Paraburkholderia sp. J8-2 TaxID=2805440 RepID=UPI002AB68B33|nr:hypothetical protein [Paraburkholderia sp. J8-2]
MTSKKPEVTPPANVPSSASMYVVKEGGLFVLRQKRFQQQLAQGKEHPHDVCAYARSVDEMHSMIDAHWPNADYSAVS